MQVIFFISESNNVYAKIFNGRIKTGFYLLFGEESKQATYVCGEFNYSEDEIRSALNAGRVTFTPESVIDGTCEVLLALYLSKTVSL